MDWRQKRQVFNMEKIKGVNLGNWLVLEKWMYPELFAGTGAEDEVWLNRKMNPEELQEKMKQHRDTYIGEQDFMYIRKQGFNLVRIPVPYFIFGDRTPFSGCIEYLDRAFDWAEKAGLKILIDLHTVPGSQNGYDNGGITGVCKWCQNPTEVEFALTVLERLAARYGTRKGLFGIEVLNEPISWLVYVTAPSTGKALDKEEAKGSSYVPAAFLEKFYRDAYRRLRAILTPDKVVMFHDGFRLGRWKRFFEREKMENVMLDTHIYVFAMESFVPIHLPFVYRIYIASQKRLIRRVNRAVPVVVGEWCLSNRYAADIAGKTPADASKNRTAETGREKKRRYRMVQEMQSTAWEAGKGWIFWSYRLDPDFRKPLDENWKEGFDLRRCLENGWFCLKEGGLEG